MADSNEEKRQIMEMALSADVKTLLSPEMERTLSRFDSSVSNIKDTAVAVNNTLNTANELVDNVAVLWSCTLETIQNVKELDVLMKQMDTTLEKYMHDNTVSLERFRTSAPILEKQLDNISNRIDRILDKALAIDSKDCAIVELELRTKLITQVKDWSDNISTLLMKLMGI